MTVTLTPRPGERTGRYVAVPADTAPGERTAPPAAPADPATPAAGPSRRARALRYGVPTTLGVVVVLPLTALVAGLLLGLLLGLVVVAQRDDAPAAAPAAASVPPAPAAAPALAGAFPDVAALAASCTPYDAGAQGYTTSTGARAVAVIRCDHGGAVPGGWVYYTQWPTAADARQWQADQVRWGPSLDGRARWDAAGQDQGPWHTRSGTDGTVYATAAYADRPYTFDVVTRSSQDTARVFLAMRLLPAAAVPA